MRGKYFWLFICILLIGFVTRLYRFDNPIGDWHSWRQSDTSAVSRNFSDRGFDVFHPRFDDLSNVPSGKNNPNGYRFVEFPIFNVAAAGLYVIFHGFSLEQWGRLVSIVSSLLSIIFIYFLVRKYADEVAALFAAFFFAVLPFSVYYGRTILPDPSMAMATLGAIWFFDQWIEKKSKIKNQRSKIQIKDEIFYFLAVIFAASALLLKPFAVFFFLPMLYIAWSNFGLGFLRKWQLWVFAIFAIAPLLLWRWWMMQYPEGIPVSDWLFNGGDIRFKGAYFYWIFADRIGRLILGYWGLALFVIGLLVNSNPHDAKKKGWFFYSFLLSSLFYVIIVARGNVQHDYYQIPLLPTLVIFLGLGSRMLLYPPKEYVNVLTSRIVLVVCVIFSLLFGWYFVRDYFNINNRSMVRAGEAVDRLTPKDAKIIAPNEGDTTFLYQTKRQGWASFQNSIPEMIVMGAGYIVLINPTEKDFEGFGKEYTIVESASEYLLLKLK